MKQNRTTASSVNYSCLRVAPVITRDVALPIAAVVTRDARTCVAVSSDVICSSSKLCMGVCWPSTLLVGGTAEEDVRENTPVGLCSMTLLSAGRSGRRGIIVFLTDESLLCLLL
jgi:hypothetical protein